MKGIWPFAVGGRRLTRLCHGTTSMYNFVLHFLIRIADIALCAVHCDIVKLNVCTCHCVVAVVVKAMSKYCVAIFHCDSSCLSQS
jgi:hypothetical protein